MKRTTRERIGVGAAIVAIAAVALAWREVPDDTARRDMASADKLRAR